MVASWINIGMMRTYLDLLEQQIAEYASDDDDWDDINHIDRKQLLPEYQEFFAHLLERGSWTSAKASNGRTIYYHTVEMHPKNAGSLGSKLIAMVAPDRRGRACVMVSFRPYYNEDQHTRRSTESRMFTPETIQAAMAYIEQLEEKCDTGFGAVREALSNRQFWTHETYEEPNLFYCTIDLYPESWDVDGSKLAARFLYDDRGRPLLRVTYIKNPYRNKRGKPDARKIFDETNIQQALPYIEQMEAKCRQYHQFRD